jgi:hypothetical protein
MIAVILLLPFALALAAETDNKNYPDIRQKILQRPFSVGVCTHFGQSKGLVDSNLAYIKNAGIEFIRDEIVWNSVELQKGNFEIPQSCRGYVRSTAEAGVQTLLILDYANKFYDDGDRPRSPEAKEGFSRYAECMARQLGDDIKLYEIWNEWDIGIGLRPPYDKGGSAEDYFNLLKAVFPRIKAVRPDAVVIAGSCTGHAVDSGWFEKVISLGALDYCDALSVHGYNYGKAGTERTPEACVQWLESIRDMVRKYNQDKDVPIYMTEMGWPNHTGPIATGTQLSASYLARLYLGSRTISSVRGIWWYDFQDDGWDPDYNENNFGIVRPDLTPKPAYYVMADIAPLAAHGKFIQKLDAEPRTLWILSFEHKNEDVWVFWSADNKARRVILRNAEQGADEKVKIHHAASPAVQTRWGYRPWVEDRQSTADDSLLSIVVDERVLLVSGNLKNVKVEKVIELKTGNKQVIF